MPNLMMPSNPRYQPAEIAPVFGYDNWASMLVQVELAVLKTLAEIGVVSPEHIELLTPEIERRLHEISTSEMDKVEREVTRHDIRALVRLMQEILPAELRPFVHIPLTSYDVIDTARAFQYSLAHRKTVQRKAYALMRSLIKLAQKYQLDVQIGRTHGQHALPITVGFWFATILNRVLYNITEADRYADGLVGKISGAVGAYNAQVGLGISIRAQGESNFEERVLNKLGLKPAAISTQIVPPEPLAYYLFSCLMISGTLGQLGRDARHLMRSEIAELAEPFAPGQVGSSTMAHKRNPLHFENVEGMWLRSSNEFGKVLATIISDHQRDLVGSSLARDFPAIVVNLVYQLDTLLRPDKRGVPFIERIVIDTQACRRNLALQRDLVLAEPIYLALQMSGYPGDAHEVVNHRAVPMTHDRAHTLVSAIDTLAQNDPTLRSAWESVPKELRRMFKDPSNYTGHAERKVAEICQTAEAYLHRMI